MNYLILVICCSLQPFKCPFLISDNPKYISLTWLYIHGLLFICFMCLSPISVPPYYTIDVIVTQTHTCFTPRLCSLFIYVTKAIVTIHKCRIMKIEIWCIKSTSHGRCINVYVVSLKMNKSRLFEMVRMVQCPKNPVEVALSMYYN